MTTTPQPPAPKPAAKSFATGVALLIAFPLLIAIRNSIGGVGGVSGIFSLLAIAALFAGLIFIVIGIFRVVAQRDARVRREFEQR